MFCAALYKYPYTVRNAIARVVPSIQVGYTGTSINYPKIFNDGQNRHLKAAKAVGLKKLPETRDDLCEMFDFLEKVKNCKAYSLARMDYSVPYLRPNAKAALVMIGTAFRDSLKSKGLPDYRVLVTSILRTRADVEKLQGSNSVAVNNSCHCYGTIFDISYKQYEPLSLFKSMSQDDLKKVLGEVLLDLIPRRVFHILGITDDALALGFVIAKVKDKITPQIEQKVAMQLDKWFGYEISMVDEQ